MRIPDAINVGVIKSECRPSAGWPEQNGAHPTLGHIQAVVRNNRVSELAIEMKRRRRKLKKEYARHDRHSPTLGDRTKVRDKVEEETGRNSLYTVETWHRGSACFPWLQESTFDERESKSAMRSKHISGNDFWASLSALAVLGMLVAMGCDFPDRPPINAPKRVERVVQNDLSDQPRTEMVEPPETQFEQDWEAWDAYFLKGKQVGYSHLLAESLFSEAIRKVSEANVQYTVEDQVRFRRGNATFVQYLNQVSIETPVGVLLDFESTLQIGPIVKHFKGVVDGEHLNIETVQGSQRSSRELDWQPAYRGLAAVQQSLRRKPMIAGESRKLKALAPIQYEMVSVELYCSGEAAVPMIDGKYKKLVEIATQYVAGPDMVVDQTIWTDEKGEIQKTLRQGDGLTSYRTDKDTALAGATSAEELLEATKIDIKSTLDRPGEATRVKMLVQPTAAMKRQGEPIRIAAQPDQYVREMGDGTFQILVSRSDAEVPDGYQAAVSEPTNEDRTANAVIDSQARLIRQLATAVGKSNRGERQLAFDLAATVRDLMTYRNTSRGLMKASEIASTPEGGSLEYSIFLAAMLRARQIPSRLAFGFVYTPGETASMSFQVWNLAYIEGKWISLDPVLGSIAPADRITLATSNMSNGNEYSVLMPILASLGQIEIEIQDAEY